MKKRRYAVVSFESKDNGKTYEVLPIRRDMPYQFAQKEALRLVHDSGVRVNEYCYIEIIREQ